MPFCTCVYAFPVMFFKLPSSVLRALGDGKTPLYAMAIAAVVNIVHDILFVVAFKWGIVGARRLL